MTLNIPNLDRLISHLEGLPEEKFNMRHLMTHDNPCGTVACIAGWCNVIAGHNSDMADATDAQSWLGFVTYEPRDRLFCPHGYYDAPERYPLSRAIRTLKHMRSEYLRTGQVVVDWDAPEPEAKPAWTAPKAVEQTKPALPAEIVRFLRPADLEVVS